MRFGLWCVGVGIWGVCTAASAAEAVATSADADLQQVVVTGHLEEDLPLDLQKTGTRVDTITAVGRHIRSNVKHPPIPARFR